VLEQLVALHRAQLPEVSNVPAGEGSAEASRAAPPPAARLVVVAPTPPPPAGAADAVLPVDDAAAARIPTFIRAVCAALAAAPTVAVTWVYPSLSGAAAAGGGGGGGAAPGAPTAEPPLPPTLWSAPAPAAPAGVPAPAHTRFSSALRMAAMTVPPAPSAVPTAEARWPPRWRAVPVPPRDAAVERGWLEETSSSLWSVLHSFPPPLIPEIEGAGGKGGGGVAAFASASESLSPWNAYVEMNATLAEAAIAVAREEMAAVAAEAAAAASAAGAASAASAAGTGAGDAAGDVAAALPPPTPVILLVLSHGLLLVPAELRHRMSEGGMMGGVGGGGAGTSGGALGVGVGGPAASGAAAARHSASIASLASLAPPSASVSASQVGGGTLSGRARGLSASAPQGLPDSPSLSLEGGVSSPETPASGGAPTQAPPHAAGAAGGSGESIASASPLPTILFAMGAPFPAEEVFRCLPARAALLRGLLGADVIALQDASHARQLGDAATRVLGLEASPTWIDCVGEDRTVRTVVAPIGLPTAPWVWWGGKGGARTAPGGTDVHAPAGSAGSTLDASGSGGGGSGGDAEVALERAAVLAVLAPRAAAPAAPSGEGGEGAAAAAAPPPPQPPPRLVLSLDTLDVTRGLQLKLLAVEAFLRAPAAPGGEAARGRVVFLFLLRDPPLTEGTAQGAATLSDAIHDMTARINGSIGSASWQPIVLLRASTLPLARLAALLSLADVGFFASLREGVTLETGAYILAQDPGEGGGGAALGGAAGSAAAATDGAVPPAAPPRGPGIPLYSEFSGGAASLRGALVVNPHAVPAVADALAAALTMRRETRTARAAQLRAHARYYGDGAWTTHVLSAAAAAAAAARSRSAAARVDAPALAATFAAARAGASAPPAAGASAPPPRLPPRRLVVASVLGTLVPFAPFLETLAQESREGAGRAGDAAGAASASSGGGGGAPLRPPARLRRALAALVADGRTDVWLVAADAPPALLDRWFGALPIGLAAEHG
jgi:trehalose-6-phosphate synthase